MGQACTTSLSNTQQSVATLSVFSLCRATWSSEPLTLAVTLATKYKQDVKQCLIYQEHLHDFKFGLTALTSWYNFVYIRMMKCLHSTST